MKAAGSDAFGAGDHEKVEACLARSKALEAFSHKALALRKEWRGLGGSGTVKGPRLGKGLRTPEASFFKPILQTLAGMGGSGKAADVMSRVVKVMRPVLRDVDFEALASDGQPRWKSSMG